MIKTSQEENFEGMCGEEEFWDVADIKYQVSPPCALYQDLRELSSKIEVETEPLTRRALNKT